MNDYLNTFNTTAEYEAYIAGEEDKYPNVAYVTEVNKVIWGFGDLVTATTYILDASGTTTDEVPASATSATTIYSVKPIYHYQSKPDETGDSLSYSATVIFDMNTVESAVTRSGNFVDYKHIANTGHSGITVPWSLTQEAKEGDFVDLGITNSSGQKVLWAKRNIGATNPEDYGKYFQWGDTVGYTDAIHSYWSTAPFNGGNGSYDSTAWASVSGSVLTPTADSDGYYSLNPEYDAATVEYGDGCRLPTFSDYKLLTANTKSTWTTQNGVKGMLFTSKVDTTKSIFVPAAGCAVDGSFGSRGSYFYAWSSSLDASAPKLAVNFSYTSYINVGASYRKCGFSIRAVKIVDA